MRGERRRALVIVYADFTCPRCAVAAERLRAAPVRTCFRHLAISARHPRALPLPTPSEAAALQGAFWELHDAIYAGQGRSTTRTSGRTPSASGLDIARFDADRRGEEVAARVAGDVRSALRAGAATTPTLVVDGRSSAGAPDAALLASLR